MSVYLRGTRDNLDLTDIYLSERDHLYLKERDHLYLISIYLSERARSALSNGHLSIWKRREIIYLIDIYLKERDHLYLIDIYLYLREKRDHLYLMNIYLEERDQVYLMDIYVREGWSLSNGYLSMWEDDLSLRWVYIR